MGKLGRNQILLDEVSDDTAAIIGRIIIGIFWFALLCGGVFALHRFQDSIKHMLSKIITTVHDKVPLWVVIVCLLFTYLVISIVNHSRKDEKERSTLQLILQILVIVIFGITWYKIRVSN